MFNKTVQTFIKVVVDEADEDGDEVVEVDSTGKGGDTVLTGLKPYIAKTISTFSIFKKKIRRF